MLLGLILFGITYYLAVFGHATWIYPPSGSPGRGAGRFAGPLAGFPWLNPMEWAGIKVEIRMDHTYDPELERVHRFGRRWRVRYLPRLDRRVRTETIVSSKMTV